MVVTLLRLKEESPFTTGHSSKRDDHVDHGDEYQ